MDYNNINIEGPQDSFASKAQLAMQRRKNLLKKKKQELEEQRLKEVEKQENQNSQDTSLSEEVVKPTNSDSDDMKKLLEEIENLKKANLKLKSSSKKSSLDFIEKSLSDEVNIKVADSDISFKSVLLVLESFAKLNKNEQEIYKLILKKTDYGKFRDMPISRAEFEEHKIQKSEISKGINQLEKLGFISFKNGKKVENSKRTRFFTLATILPTDEKGSS